MLQYPCFLTTLKLIQVESQLDEGDTLSFMKNIVLNKSVPLETLEIGEKLTFTANEGITDIIHQHLMTQ